MPGLLPAERTTRVIGPISGLQIAGVVVGLFGVAGILAIGQAVSPLLIIMLGPLFAVVLLLTLFRLDDRSGWEWLPVVAAAARYRGGRTLWAVTASDTRPVATGRVFDAAPGALARAEARDVPGFGAAFILPGRQADRVVLAWLVDGRPLESATDADVDMLMQAWAGGLNTLTSLPGVRGIELHADTVTRPLPAPTVDGPAGEQYAELLAQLVDRPAARVTLAVVLRADQSAPETARIIVDTLANAGIRAIAPVNARAIGERLAAADRVDGHEPTWPAQQRPVVPAYNDRIDVMQWTSGALTVAMRATSAESVAVGADVLAALLAPPTTPVRRRVHVLLRPATTRSVVADRARQRSLKNQVNEAQSSFWTNLMTDSARAERELEVLQEQAKRGARGENRVEAIVTATITAETHEAIAAALTEMKTQPSPLRFTPVVYPAAVVLAATAPIGTRA